MSEQLGDAVLILRTDDRGLNAGVDQAEAKSKQLGRTFDATSGSATRLGQSMTEAGSGASRLAGHVDKLTTATGAQRAGQQQLAMNFNDMITMYQLGARPMQIFMSQIGQTTQALQLMAGGTSRVAAVLGSPWVLMLSTAAMIVVPLITNLLSADKAMGEVKAAADGLTDAQSVLGGMFDLTTGKIKSQNEMLRLNAQLMAINLRSQASTERTTSKETLGFSGSGLGMSWTNRALGYVGVNVQGAFGRAQDVAGVASQVNAIDPTAKGAGERLAALAKQAEKLNFDGLNVTKEEFLNAISSRMSAALKDKTATAIEKSLADGILDPSLRTDAAAKKTPKGPKGKTAEEIAAEQAAEIERLGLEELRAKMALATTAEDRRDIAIELLEAERAQRVREIETNKDLSDAQKAARMAFIDRLYGKSAQTGPDGSMTVGGTRPLLAGKAWTDFEGEQARLANDMLGRQADTLLSMAEIEPNMKARARLEEQALELQQQIQRNLLEQQIASGNVADAEKARALLTQQQAAAQARQSQRNLSPGQRYAVDLRNEAANINDAIETIQVNGLERLNDELTKAVMGTQSLGATFKNVANQIIADLIRIAIRQAIVAPLAGLMFGVGSAGSGGGGGGGLFGSLLGGVLGSGGGGAGGSGGSNIAPGETAGMLDSDWQRYFGLGGFGFGGQRGGGLLAGALGGFAGMFAGGGLIPTGTFGIVGERGPEPVISTAQGAMVRPNSTLSQMGGGGGRPGTLKVEVVGARGNREIEEMVQSGVASGLAAYDGIVGDRVQDHLARRG